MTRTPKLAAAAAAISTCLLTTAAGASPTIDYRATLAVKGAWTESVRADADPGDSDHDGAENVVSRDSQVRFALAATMDRVPLRGGRVAQRVEDVATTALTQEVLSSTFTDFDGVSGTCAPQSAAATGGGTVARVGDANVFRPSSDALLDLVCTEPYARFSMSVDLLRVAAANAVPELGGAPVDVAFAVPAARAGDWRIAVPVAASAAQRSFSRCPREDPGHTVACGFDWAGVVTLERLAPELSRARLTRTGVQLDVRCAVACTPQVQAGRAAQTFSVAPGRARRLTLKLSRPARAARAMKVRVTIGGERMSVTARR